MAGMTESAGAQDDDFVLASGGLSFRVTIDARRYRGQRRSLCRDAEGGYTAVGEFHCLHHAPDGAPYDDPAEMSHRITAAADRSGIGLTLLPVLYAQEALTALQRKRGNVAMCVIWTYPDRRDGYAQGDANSAGVAAHSLRAVGPDALQIAIELAGEHPVHIHIAEQTREVKSASLGAVPVRSNGYCRMQRSTDASAARNTYDAAETRALAESGAVAGLCPMTEADLGDGILQRRRLSPQRAGSDRF